METPVMTKQEVVDYLKISWSELDKKIKKNEIPYFKIGSQIRFNKDQIDAIKSGELQ